MLFVALTIAFFAGSFYLDQENFLSSLWILLLPIILSPFVEWFLHRFALHRIVDPAKSPWNYAYMLNLHYKHHWEPTHIPSVFAPISGVLIVVGFFTPLAYLVFRNLPMTLIFGAGTVSYFLFYEWIHLAHHMSNYKPVTAYGRLIRKAHTWHHYKNENYWWGVTNPLGDYCFGTFKDPKEVEFSPSAKSLGDLQKQN